MFDSKLKGLYLYYLKTKYHKVIIFFQKSSKMFFEQNLFVWMNDNQLYFGLQSTNRYYGYINILGKATHVAIYDSLLQRNLTGTV